ncbi:response regulator [Hymenobacter wooponensis]|uniref:Response regulator n=1 Tax=Hymenobacter wooponensis TaxID=1525360 RepID=A0A4Z0MJC5_9BACT|nr:response regulator [Hymenobacter wooponensis]TGD79644.1 response regulator [Hymenobacter wooponensis]
MHIVLIDDDSTSIFLMRLLLQRENFAETITTFQSATEALRFLEHAVPEQRPQVILLDLNMPVMSGWDFLDSINGQASELLENCRVYILTSSLAYTDKLRAEENPFVTRLIHKPLDKAELAAIKAEAAG